MNTIFYGIMTANFILADGKHILTEKDKNMALASNLHQEDIDIKVILMMENDLDME